MHAEKQWKSIENNILENNTINICTNTVYFLLKTFSFLLFSCTFLVKCRERKENNDNKKNSSIKINIEKNNKKKNVESTNKGNLFFQKEKENIINETIKTEKLPTGAIFSFISKNYWENYWRLKYRLAFDQTFSWDKWSRYYLL